MEHRDGVAAAVLNDAGTHLAVADGRGCWLFVDSSSWTERFPTPIPIGHHRRPGTAVAFNRGKVVTAAKDGTVAWSNLDGSLNRVMSCFTDSNPYHGWWRDQRVQQIDFSGDGRLMLTVEFDVDAIRGRVRIWDQDNIDKPVRTSEQTDLATVEMITAAFFDPTNDRRVIVVCASQVYIWEAPTTLHPLEGHGLSRIARGAISANGLRVVLTGPTNTARTDVNETVKLFDLGYVGASTPQLKLIGSSDDDDLGIVTDMGFRAQDDLTVLLTSKTRDESADQGSEGEFSIWRPPSKRVVAKPRIGATEEYPSCVSYSRSRHRYLVGTQGPGILMFDDQKLELIGKIRTPAFSMRMNESHEMTLWRFEIQSQRDGPVYYYSINPCVPPAFTNRTPAFKVFAPIEGASDAYVGVYLMNRNLADSYSTQVYRYASSPTPPAGFKVSDIASKEQGKPAPLFLLYAKPSGNARLPVYQYERATSDPNTKKYCLARGNDQPPDSGYVKMGTEPLGWVPT